MLILLPPSEGKTQPHLGRTLDLQRLSFPELTERREDVIVATQGVSASPDALEVLKVSPGLAGEVERNTRLFTAPTAAAGSVYSGVLYDALDLPTLDPAARRRAARSIVVVSAMFGAVRLTDCIPAYRLSMSVRLPEVGGLAAAWRPHLATVLPDAAGDGLVVDCRSSTYVAAWKPKGELAERWVHVAVPGASHMAKYTRGLVARALAEDTSRPRTPEALADVLAETFDVEITPPARAGHPWVVGVSERDGEDAFPEEYEGP